MYKNGQKESSPKVAPPFSGSFIFRSNALSSSHLSDSVVSAEKDGTVVDLLHPMQGLRPQHWWLRAKSFIVAQQLAAVETAEHVNLEGLSSALAVPGTLKMEGELILIDQSDRSERMAREEKEREGS